MLNKRGLTLVEVLIAMVLLLFVSLAMMQTALVSIDANTTNALRDEAAAIAEIRMNEAMSLPYTSTTDSLISDASSLPGGTDCPTTFTDRFVTTGVLRRVTTDTSDSNYYKTIKNIQVDFCTNRTVITTSDRKQVTIAVGWRWKGQNYPLHTVSTIVRRQ